MREQASDLLRYYNFNFAKEILNRIDSGNSSLVNGDGPYLIASPVPIRDFLDGGGDFENILFINYSAVQDSALITDTIRYFGELIKQPEYTEQAALDRIAIGMRIFLNNSYRAANRVIPVMIFVGNQVDAFKEALEKFE